jgi:hypothetical protein
MAGIVAGEGLAGAGVVGIIAGEWCYPSEVSEEGGIMVDLSAVRIRGPLEPFAAGFIAELVRLGYTLFSARGQLELAAHLSRWLAEQGMDFTELTAQVVGAFFCRRTSRSNSKPWTAPPH